MKRQYEEAEKDAELKRLILTNFSLKGEGRERREEGDRKILDQTGHTTDGAAQGKRPKTTDTVKDIRGDEDKGTNDISDNVKSDIHLVGIDGVKIKQERMDEGAEVERAEKESYEYDEKKRIDIIELKDTASSEESNNNKEVGIAEGWELDEDLLYDEVKGENKKITDEPKNIETTTKNKNRKGILGDIKNAGASVGEKIVNEFKKIYEEGVQGQEIKETTNINYQKKDETMVNEDTDESEINIGGKQLVYKDLYNKYIPDGAMSFDEMKMALQKTERHKQQRNLEGNTDVEMSTQDFISDEKVIGSQISTVKRNKDNEGTRDKKHGNLSQSKRVRIGKVEIIYSDNANEEQATDTAQVDKEPNKVTLEGGDDKMEIDEMGNTKPSMEVTVANDTEGGITTDTDYSFKLEQSTATSPEHKSANHSMEIGTNADNAERDTMNHSSNHSEKMGEDMNYKDTGVTGGPSNEPMEVGTIETIANKDLQHTGEEVGIQAVVAATKTKESRMEKDSKQINNPYKIKYLNQGDSTGSTNQKGQPRGRGRGGGPNRNMGQQRYQAEIYGGTKEAREWRKDTKMSEIVLEVTVWLKQKHKGKYKYDMNDAIPHLQELLAIIRQNDEGACITNKFETEQGGEEHGLIEIKDGTKSITGGILQPFFHRPMINRYRGTFHVKVALRSSMAMNRGREQRNYLSPIFELYNRRDIAFVAYDPVQEIHQFKIGAFIGISSEFNEVDARKDIMRDALEIYERERAEALAKKEEYSDFPVELKLIRSDLQAVDMKGQTSAVSVAWLHAGKKSAIIAEKLIQKYESIQDNKVDGETSRIFSRNLRVIRTPKTDTETGLYDLVISLKQNQLMTITKTINYIHRVDQKVELNNGEKVTLREVFLRMKDEKGKNMFRHVDKVKRGRGINVAYYRIHSEAATMIINNLTNELKKIITPTSYAKDLLLGNNSSPRLNFMPGYNPDRTQTQTNNYANSVAFFQDKNNGPEKSATSQLDIKTVPARTLNQATSSGMSWADTVKLLTPSTTTFNNNLSSTTTTVNQQINQIVLNQNTKDNGTEKATTDTTQSVAMNQSTTTSRKKQQTTLVRTSTDGMQSQEIQRSEFTLSFEEKMKALQQTIQKNEKESEDRLVLMGTTINDLISSNDRRFTQVQTFNQIQTQACMMGIQELAAKLNLQISPPDDLVKRAKEEISQLGETKEIHNKSPNLLVSDGKDKPKPDTTCKDDKQSSSKAMDVDMEEDNILVSQSTPECTQEEQSQQSQQLLTQLSPPVGSSGDGNF